MIYGNLLSLPVGNGMLYIEPLYLKTKGDNSYPFLRKVLVAYQKYVAYADDLTSGLESLVQQATGQSRHAADNRHVTADNGYAAAGHRRARRGGRRDGQGPRGPQGGADVGRPRGLRQGAAVN